MPRRSRLEKQETHERILLHASRLFRRKGTQRGIAELMGDLGLTKGGFYRHFASKEALLVQSVALALDEVSERLESIAKRASPGHQMRAIINAYLSEEHVNDPGSWCALASLGAELGREIGEQRAPIEAAIGRYTARIAPYVLGKTVAEKRRNVLLLMSGMAGAITFVRLVPDARQRRAMLKTLREDFHLRFHSAAAK